MRALIAQFVNLTLNGVRSPWIKRIMRRAINRAVAALLRLRSHDYVLGDESVALFVAPHQDDSSLGCGGLIARKRLNGCGVHVVYVTDGSASHPGHPTLTSEALATLRESEGRAALSHLGVDRLAVHFLGARDGTLAHLSPAAESALQAEFNRLLLAVRPDEVFLPYRRDGSSEHEAASRLFLGALAGTGIKPRLYEYLVWSWWNPLRLLRPWLTARHVWRFRFPGYEGIKSAALKCYSSQFEPTPPWSEPVLDRDFARMFKRPCEFYLEF